MSYGPEYWVHFLDDLDEEDYGGDHPHLISVDELRAAGALDVPAAWRKSLATDSRYTLPGFSDDDDDSILDLQVDDESAESTDEYARTDQAHESTSFPPHQPMPDTSTRPRQARTKK